MFGFVIGGSGTLYLAVPVDEGWMGWRKIASPAEYRLFGRRGGCYRILLNNPTGPHAFDGRVLDPPLERHREQLADWRLLPELRAHVLDTVLGP